MKKIEIKNYQDLEQIKEIEENEFIVSLDSCPLKLRERVIDFLGGLTLLHGSLKKLKATEFEVKLKK